MDCQKYLFMVWDKENGKFMDKTEKIRRYEYAEGYYKIYFHKTEKPYTYPYKKIRFFNNPIVMNGQSQLFHIDDRPVEDVRSALQFGAEYIKIFHNNGYIQTLPLSCVLIENNVINKKEAHNRLKYFKELAREIGDKKDNDKSFLEKQYEHLKLVSPRSALAIYLEPEIFGMNESEDKNVFFPFSFNTSQKEAAEKALMGPISVIEGPPGTGKTQTILNIIANIVMEGKNVAIVSNNNSATRNVLEKLDRENVGFIAAFLGKKTNQECFFEAQDGRYPDMSGWKKLDSDEKTKLENNLVESREQLDEKLEIKNHIAELRQDRDKLRIERDHFRTYYQGAVPDVVPYRSLYTLKSKDILAILASIEKVKKERKEYPLWIKLKNLVRYGIVSFGIYKENDDKLVAFFKNEFYNRRLNELETEIRELGKKLENFGFESAMKKYQSESMTLFKATLSSRYDCNTERPIFNSDILWKDCKSFFKEYPVILSTTHALRMCKSEQSLFDYVIIDESSQVDLVTGVLALSCAKKAVIVGDQKQLPNIITSEVRKKADGLYSVYKLPKQYKYTENTLLSSVIGLFQEIPHTLLKEHYRCHPKIIDFCNQEFYDNELIIMTEDHGRKEPLVSYLTVAGNHSRGHYNQRQIDVIRQEIMTDPSFKKAEVSIGIVAPYNKQVDAISKEIQQENIEIATVHKFQGREKNVIILSTVDNQIGRFVDDPNLINVAVSRAIDQLFLVISKNELNWNTQWGDLMRYISYQQCKVINSKIHSVFDLLYKGMEEQRKKLLNKHGKVGNSPAEDLMNVIIQDVLKMPDFSHIDRVLHPSLNTIVRNTDLLTEKEERFVKNPWTHLDFLLFRKIDKSPLLAVEVDGYAFHADKPEQLKRDQMKDHILNKYDLPIIRFGTNESNEKERLVKKLHELLDVVTD
ncbi:DNA helicase [Eubacterium limosum]|nr:DNA helicase [Eubacterium limosum]